MFVSIFLRRFFSTQTTNLPFRQSAAISAYIDATKYKCCQKENYSDIKVYDPIEKETCTYAALRARKYRNKTLYKNVIVMKQNLSGIGDA